MAMIAGISSPARTKIRNIFIMPSAASINSKDSYCSLCGSSSIHQEDAGYLYCYACWKGEDYADKYNDDPYDKDYY